MPEASLLIMPVPSPFGDNKLVQTRQDRENKMSTHPQLAQAYITSPIRKEEGYLCLKMKYTTQ